MPIRFFFFLLFSVHSRYIIIAVCASHGLVEGWLPACKHLQKVAHSGVRQTVSIPSPNIIINFNFAQTVS